MERERGGVAERERTMHSGSEIRTDRQRPLRLRAHTVLRWLHIYISMASLLIVFFFAITGISLNHPDWSITTREAIGEEEGVLPAGWDSGAEPDWLAIVEHLRNTHAIRAPLADFRIDDFEGSLSFRAPGYTADIFFQPDSGEYQVTTVRFGPVGILNALHRGTDAAPSWKVLIDLAGVLLAVLSITGIGLLLYLKKFRRPALITMALGSALVLTLASLML